MKLLILFGLVIAASAQNSHLTAEQKEKVHKYIAECIEETGVKREVLAEAKKGNLSNDEGMKKFFFCFFKKTGILSSNGELNIETTIAKLPPGIDKTAAAQTLNECKSKTGKDPADKAFNIFKCYRAGIKQHIIFE